MKILGLDIRWPTKSPSCRYQPPYDGDLLRGPHCDPYVLHIDSCDACEEYIEAKAERIHKGINFTGSTIPGRTPCPAEAQRPLEVINLWPGNRPIKYEEHAS